ncbi:S-layer homology domain-containing protein [Candidatus Peregrinibacteria bacterium]|nr:S-layer homology domain-containing protein [Candidatus Peregrinibacteria bacterium]
MTDLRRFFRKGTISAALIAAVLFTMVPFNTAFGTAFSYNSTTGLVTVSTSIGSYFYRVPHDAAGNVLPLTGGNDNSSYLYGYGYSFNANTSTYSYGYGYGYGYAYFATVGTSWTQGDSKLGFFSGTSSGTPTSATFSTTSAGVATVAAATSLTSSLAGTAVKLPAGLVITGTSSWTGALTITGTTTLSALAANIQSAFASASGIASVSIGTGGVALSLSDEVIVTIPFTGFAALSSPILVILDNAGATTQSAACTASQYTGATTSTTDLTDSSKYSVSAGGDCYVVGTGAAAGSVYVATRHLTTFIAGNAASASTSSSSVGSTVGGGSGGGGEAVKKKTPVAEAKEKVEAGEELSKVFNDFAGVAKADWRYAVVETVVKAGLFGGETVNGKKVFNMNNGMNRAMAATVIARYAGCSDAKVNVAPFSDVAVDAWYAPSVACLKTMGVVSGKNATTFDPNGLVTRAEFFKMLTEAYMKKNPAVEKEFRALLSAAPTMFADVGGKEWYAGYLNLAQKKGLLKGYEKGGKKYASGNNTIIRVEAAAMVSNYLGL